DISQDAEQRPRRADSLHTPVAAQDDRLHVTAQRNRQTRSPFVQTQPHVAHGAEPLRARLTKKRIVQQTQNLPRTSLMHRDGSDAVTSQAGKDGGLRPFAADVTYDGGPSTISGLEDVVEVASHFIPL